MTNIFPKEFSNFFYSKVEKEKTKNQPRKGKQETWKSWVGKKNEVNKTWNRFMLGKNKLRKKKKGKRNFKNLPRKEKYLKIIPEKKTLEKLSQNRGKNKNSPQKQKPSQNEREGWKKKKKRKTKGKQNK